MDPAVDCRHHAGAIPLNADGGILAQMAIDESGYRELSCDSSALGAADRASDDGHRTDVGLLAVAARIANHAVFVAVARTLVGCYPEAKL